MRILASANVLLLLAACARGEDESARVQSVDQLAAASPDSTMKQRWRDAAAKGQIPSLDSLPRVSTRLTTRTPAQVVDTVRTPVRPTIQQGVVATVRAFSTPPIELYSGAFTVTSATASSIIGSLAGRAEPFELIYKLPDTAQLAQPAPNAPHQLRVRDEVDNQSVRREFILSTNDRVPVLAYISDGGMRPYSRRFAELPLTVTQLAPGADSVSRVTVTLGGASTTLRPGDRGRLTVGGGPIGVFVESSYWTPSAQVETAEGDAYHVTLMIYRTR
jgi:hypothetical protein